MSSVRCAPVLLLLAATAAGAGQPVAYAVAIGNNAPPLGGDGHLRPLRFADDDAVRFDQLLGRFTARHDLLATLDASTLRRYPAAAERARPPSLAALRETVAELAALMRRDVERGDEPRLYLTYSGHGDQDAEGNAFLAMVDGALTRQVLYEEVLAVLPAGVVHLFVDACHAEAVVGTRGAPASEREATLAPLRAQDLAAWASTAGLRRFPRVGVMLATTEEQLSHEWGQLQSGVFTHEVLSGLSGAADVNGDGVVEYSELQAFVALANRDLPDPRALPRVVASPPPDNPRVGLVYLPALQGVGFLDGALFELGHFHVELEGGERLLDAHLGPDLRARLALPAGRLAYLVAGEREAELRVASGGRVSPADLSFRPREDSARGSLDSAFRRGLFQSPFGPEAYRDFALQAGLEAVPLALTRPALASSGVRRDLGITALALGGAAALASATTGSLAGKAQADYDATNLQRPAAEARQQALRFTTVAIATGVVSAGLLIAGGVLVFPVQLPGLAAEVRATGPGLALTARF